MFRAGLGSLCVAVLVGLAGSAPALDDRPNILFVLVDTLRFDRLGLYGFERETSPFLDSLSKTGWVFDNAHAQAPETQTSTATLFTSRLFPLMERTESARPLRGPAPLARAMSKRLALENTTLAEALAAGGYQTLGVFTNPFHHPESGFYQGFGRVTFLSPGGRRRAAADGADVNRAFRRLLSASDRRRPIFAYLHYMDVHAPYAAPASVMKQFAKPNRDFRYALRVPNGRPSRPPNPWELQRLQNLYAAEVRYVDDLLAGLWSGLQPPGLESDEPVEPVESVEPVEPGRRWVLLLASDHGEEFMEHGGLGHGRTLEKEMLRVPLMLHGVPGRAGTREQRQVRNLDIAPTLLEIAEIEAAPTFEGRSLLGGGIDRDASSELENTSFARRQRSGLRSVTTPKWHFILDVPGRERRLYDNLTDRVGLRNLVEARPAVAADLAAMLRRRFAELSLVEQRELSSGVAELPAPAPELIDQLEALGYLD